jgi:hypothetical protein
MTMNSAELISVWEGFKEEGLKFTAKDDPDDDEVILSVCDGQRGTTLYIPKVRLAYYTPGYVRHLKCRQVEHLHELLRDL